MIVPRDALKGFGQPWSTMLDWELAWVMDWKLEKGLAWACSPLTDYIRARETIGIDELKVYTTNMFQFLA